VALFILAIPLALIATNIRVAVSEHEVYDYAVREYGAAEVSGIPESELIRANGEIRDYLTSGDSGLLAINVRTEKDSTIPLFSARETAHMADVQELVGLLFTVQVAGVLAALTMAILIVVWSPRLLATAALAGSLLTVGLLAAAGLIAASGFDSAWTEFHVVAFSNDLWQLDPSRDHLIQMFPEQFWFEITTLIVLATIAEAVLISGAAAGYLYMTRARDATAYRLSAPPVAGSIDEPRPALARQKARHSFR
jgi:integral membrane protein (TIGR01906 family)